MSFRINIECDSCGAQLRMMAGHDISMTKRHRRMYAAKAYMHGWDSYKNFEGVRFLCGACIEKYSGTKMACIDNQYRE